MGREVFWGCVCVPCKCVPGEEEHGQPLLTRASFIMSDGINHKADSTKWKRRSEPNLSSAIRLSQCLLNRWFTHLTDFNTSPHLTSPLPSSSSSTVLLSFAPHLSLYFSRVTSGSAEFTFPSLFLSPPSAIKHGYLPSALAFLLCPRSGSGQQTKSMQTHARFLSFFFLPLRSPLSMVAFNLITFPSPHSLMSLSLPPFLSPLWFIVLFTLCPYLRTLPCCLSSSSSRSASSLTEAAIASL